MTRYENRSSAAGIVIVRKFSDGWKILGLKDGGEYDMPKGKLDPDETIFDCALRETNEESGLTRDNLLFSWGKIKKPIKHIVFFIAETKSDPVIKRNPESGIFEHESADWLSWDDLESKCYPYLSEVVRWARTIVEGG